MIQLDNVNFSFDSTILHDATFKFDDGKIYYIVARNGAGKSTLFKLINNDLKADSGKISFSGSMILHSQIPVYFEDMTVKENLEVFINCFNSEETIGEVIAKYQLAEILNKVARKLSGGEKQKLYLGITSLCDDDNYLFDEADSALDAGARKMVYEEFRRKANIGKTVIVISHHISETMQVADEICLLHHKKLSRVKKDTLPKNFSTMNEDSMLNELERSCISK